MYTLIQLNSQEQNCKNSNSHYTEPQKVYQIAG